MPLLSADFFQNIFFKNFFREHNQSVKRSVRPDLGPIVCKGYQQVTEVATSKERVEALNSDCHK